MRNFQRTAKVAVGLLGLALSYSAAACCPDVGHSPAAATTGLGASRPSATDLSAVSTLRVYTFERDGIRYLQVGWYRCRPHQDPGGWFTSERNSRI